MQGSLLKQAQVRADPQAASIVTQAGLSGGTQHGMVGLNVVPGGQTPPSGIMQVPPGDGWTQACAAPQVIWPQLTPPLVAQAPSWSFWMRAIWRWQSLPYVRPSQPQTGEKVAEQLDGSTMQWPGS